MSMWGSEDTRNVYAGLNSKRQQDRAGWLQPVGTALGAGAGFLVGGPAGAVAGSQLGGAAGGLGHDAANGNLTPQGVMGSAMEGVSGYQGLDKSMQAKALIEAFMQNPHQFRLGFATGGPVLSPSMDPNLLQRLLYGSQGAGVPSGPTQTPQGDPVASSDVLGAIPGQVQQMIGQPPVQPTPNPLQQAQHPTLEALSAILPQIMAAMPRPANPKNTKAIGAWLPAAGLAASAPAAIAQSRRASANAPIQAGNESRQADYEARKKAYEAQQGTLMNTLAGNATKPFAGEKQDRFNTPLPDGLRKQLGVPATIRTYGELDEYQQSQTMSRLASPPRASGMGGAPADDGYLLSPEALRQQAIHFAVTGTYALSGRNKEISKEQVRISNEAARLFPKRQLALARAAYNGDKSSMAKIVQGRDGIEAFAHSAEKNLGMMKDVLTQIPEAGAEVFNTPVRQFESQFRGNPAMSAFHALRMSLNAEYSRLTQSAQISGVGIPVSAQKEIERAIAPGATVGQILSAYQVLYEESSNRADAMNAMVEQIGQRMNLEPPADTRPPMSGGIKKGK